MPFGGRDKDIEWLNDWLGASDSSPCLLLWGPAGRGKSALLVHWVEQLPPQLARAFVPISIRADTNSPSIFYSALASRLATILGKPPPSNLADPIASPRERVKEYFREFTDPENPCLIVIDGLDEASGWDLDRSVLPASPPPGLRIVVSARQLAGDDRDKDWLRRLGWNMSQAQAQSREVRPLTREGVSDVLHRMGDPLAHLAGSELIVDELFRLTEQGDPLLLALYVEDLRRSPEEAGQIKPESLRARKPGFGDFFRNWYDEQQKAWGILSTPPATDLIDAILAVLACAMGPLMLSDISAILDRVLPVRPAPITLTTLTPLRRFIIGFAGKAASADESDESRRQGFVLSHPRLAEFFREEYFADTSLIIDIGVAFRDWGRAAARGDGAKRGGEIPVPRYVLLYYLQHLHKDPHTPLEWYRELASDRWRSAWRAAEGGYGTYSAQMSTCWRRLHAAHQADRGSMRDPYTGLAGLIHIGLCISSVRSIGTSIPPNCIAEMVAQGFLTTREAILIARNRGSDYTRKAILTALAKSVDRTPSIFAEIVRETDEVRSLSIACEVLLALAEQSPPDLCAPVLYHLTERLAAEGDFGETRVYLGTAFGIAQAIDRRLLQEVFEFAEARLERERVPDIPAEHEATNIFEAPAPGPMLRRPPDPDFSPAGFSSRILSQVSDLSAEDREAFERIYAADEDVASPETLEELARLILSVHPFYQQVFLADLAPSLSPAQCFAIALRALDPDSLSWGLGLLGTIAPYLDDEGRAGLVPLILSRMESEERHYDYLQQLLNVLGSMSSAEIAKAVPLLDSISHPFSSLQIYQQISDKLGEEEIAAIVAAARLPEADEFELQHRRDLVVGAVRARLSDDQVRQLLDSALPKQAPIRIDLLREIVPAFSGDLLREAVRRAVERPLGDQPSLLALLVPHAAEKAADQLEIILDASHALDDVGERLIVIDAVLPHLAPERRREVLAAVRGIALDIGDEPFIALALAAIGESLTLPAPENADRWSNFLQDAKTNTVAAVSLAFIALLPDIAEDYAAAVLPQARHRAGLLSVEDRLVVELIAAICPKQSRADGERAVRDAKVLIETGLSNGQLRILFHSILLLSPYLDAESRGSIVSSAQLQIRNSKLDDLIRWGIACALACAPAVTKSVSDDAALVIREAISAGTPDDDVKDGLNLVLALSGHLSREELAGIERRSDTSASNPDLSISDFFRSGLLSYRKDASDWRFSDEFASRLAQLKREDALILLALLEGRWGATFDFRPAFSDGAQPTRVLGLWGGPDAVREVAASIRQVSQWWP